MNLPLDTPKRRELVNRLVAHQVAKATMDYRFLDQLYRHGFQVEGYECWSDGALLAEHEETFGVDFDPSVPIDVKDRLLNTVLAKELRAELIELLVDDTAAYARSDAEWLANTLREGRDPVGAMTDDALLDEYAETFGHRWERDPRPEARP